MVGLAYIAAAADRRVEALAILDEAAPLAEAHGAHNVLRDIAQARNVL